MLSGNQARASSALLVDRARAEADVVAGVASGGSERQAAQARLADLVSRAFCDPFGPDSVGADLAANTAQWHAEPAQASRPPKPRPVPESRSMRGSRPGERSPPAGG